MAEPPDRSKAACLGAGVHLFFPKGHHWQENLAEGAKLCRVCPIQVECHQHGVENENFGMWGGQLVEPVFIDRIYGKWHWMRAKTDMTCPRCESTISAQDKFRQHPTDKTDFVCERCGS